MNLEWHNHNTAFRDWTWQNGNSREPLVKTILQMGKTPTEKVRQPMEKQGLSGLVHSPGSCKKPPHAPIV
jgi:hypothetical protein